MTDRPYGATPIRILMADDDPDDCMMAQEALDEARLANEINFVHDGEELMDFLKRRGKYENPEDSPRPLIILLDLNMPKKDGREAMKEIKSDPTLSGIPIIVLTTSKADEDVVRSYGIGASGYVSKPVTFEGLVDVMRSIGKYWLEIVELPGRRKDGR